MKKYIKNLGKVRPTSNGNWDKNKEYDILSIVKVKQTKNVYISKKYVPANIEITNTEYWDNIIDNSLDIHFYEYNRFEDLTLESTVNDITFALHTINGEFRFPKAGDILIDLENDINSVFLYTENPAALDERHAKVTYFIYNADNFNIPLKNIFFNGNNYENDIHITQIDIYSFNDLQNKINKNTNDITANTTNINNINNKLRDFIPNNKLGKANGVASLNESGKIPSNQLPSYVDDVIYVERIIDRFESSGRADNLYYAYIGEDKTKGIYNGYINNATLIESFYTDKIYILNRTSTISNITYNANSSIRWNGIKLVEIGSAHLTIGIMEGTAFDGKRGKDNEDKLNSHINNKVNPHKVTKAQIGLNNVTNDAQVKRSEMGVANGVPVLDEDGKYKDENLDIISVPDIESHYGFLVKKNMGSSDSIGAVEAYEVFNQFQSISPKSNNCIIKAGDASNVDGIVQYSISAENNPKFSEVLEAYKSGANIILDTFIDALQIDRHRINITTWNYNNSDTLNGIEFACRDFNNQTIDITITKSGDNIQGNFKILSNFASANFPGLMSTDSYINIIECKNSITNINEDVNKLKQIDSGDGEMLVTGGTSPFTTELLNNGFNINYRYSSPILESAGEENITIPIAGNTTPGLLPKGYKSKIDTTAVKVNTLNNFGLVGRILVKSDGDGFIDKTSTIYLLTGNSDIANFDTATSSKENAAIEIPKTTIQITNIGIEYVSTNGSTGFTITSSKEIDKFIININKIELQNNQPIIINLYNL